MTHPAVQIETDLDATPVEFRDRVWSHVATLLALDPEDLTAVLGHLTDTPSARFTETNWPDA